MTVVPGHGHVRPYHVPMKVTGPDGRSFSATEWFKVSEGVVDAAVGAALSP